MLSNAKRLKPMIMCEAELEPNVASSMETTLKGLSHGLKLSRAVMFKKCSSDQ